MFATSSTVTPYSGPGSGRFSLAVRPEPGETAAAGPARGAFDAAGPAAVAPASSTLAAAAAMAPRIRASRRRRTVTGSAATPSPSIRGFLRLAVRRHQGRRAHEGVAECLEAGDDLLHNGD